MGEDDNVPKTVLKAMKELLKQENYHLLDSLNISGKL